MKNQPSVIYRYRSFNADTVNMLCNDEQYFSMPINFNDPFDSNPVIIVDSALSVLKEILRELVSSRVRTDTLQALKEAKIQQASAHIHAEQRGQAEASLALGYAEYHSNNPEYDDKGRALLGMLHFDIEHELRGRYGKGICCFSEEYNNPLLWSHYGDQHKGICIGYTLDRRPEPVLQKVKYGNDRTITTSLLAKAILNKNASAIKKLDAAVLLRKAPEWSYEKEWRIIGTSGLQPSPLKLSEITFGYRCSAAVQHTIMKALESRSDVSFYEIRNVPGTFLLKRVAVDFEDLMFLPQVAASGVEIFGDSVAAAGHVEF